jgi:hypothetical protein
MKYFVVSLILFSMFVGVIPFVDAKGADEPCSYLNPTKYVRDSAGNCVLASSGSASVAQSGAAQTGVSQARSTSEPCSYLNPTKYVRDSAGNCVLAPQTPVPQVVPSTATVTAPASSSGNLLEVAVVFLLGILAFIAYKIFGKRLRQPRIKYRPRQTPPQKPEPFVGNQSTAESSTTVQEAADTWNGGYYDDDTLEKFK